jgi:hypothetical protein
VAPESVRPGTVFGPVTDATANFEYTVGGISQPFPEGDYELFAVCTGQGTVVVSWDAPGSSGSTGVVCGNGSSTMAEFHSERPGLITLRLVADDLATNRAGVAVKVTDPLMVTAQNALSPPPVSTILSGSGTVDALGIAAIDEAGGPVGTYTLSVVCAGEGTLRATFTAGEATASKSVPCSPTPEAIDIQLVTTQAGVKKDIIFEPDTAASGVVGYAFHVTG